MQASIDWQHFVEKYMTLQVACFRKRTQQDTRSVLTIVGRILRPKTLDDVANPEAMQRLQLQALAGDGGRPKAKKRKRSPHTVKKMMRVVLAALRWAEDMEFIARVPKVRIVRTAKLRQAKGRPITPAEFEQLLSAIPAGLVPKDRQLHRCVGRRQVSTCPNCGHRSHATSNTRGSNYFRCPKCGERFASRRNTDNKRSASHLAEMRLEKIVPSWQYTLRGLWESGLRVGELMAMSWDMPDTIRPHWPDGAEPYLQIPAAAQKNDTEEAIPLVPGFERLLRETPESRRTGYCFTPLSLWGVYGARTDTPHRITPCRVSRTIARIGRASGVVVRPEAAGTQARYVTAHDLRRSFAQRLIDAGLPEQVVMQVTRHSDSRTLRTYYAIGDLQTSARLIRRTLENPGENRADFASGPRGHGPNIPENAADEDGGTWSFTVGWFE